jgi:predicted aldo/keto reductase-like oxidoreductase
MSLNRKLSVSGFLPKERNRNMKKLGFGFMRLPLKENGAIDNQTLIQMVDYYLAHGFTYFDTSYVYHGGKSETAIRETLTSRYPRDAYILASKMPTWNVFKKEDVRRFCEEQLEKTGAGYFDNYLMHMLTEKDYSRMVEIGAFDEFRKLKEEGKIRHICCSFHDTADVLDRILDEQPDIESVQILLNYADMADEDLTVKAAYETVVKHGRNVIVMEPVKGGELAEVPEEIETMFRKYNPEASNASWAIRSMASLPGVMVVLSGMSTMAQVKDNVSYMENFEPLNEEEKEIVKKAGDVFFGNPPINYQHAKIVNPAVKTFLALMNNRLVFAIPHGWQDAMYNSYVTRAGKVEDLIKDETDPAVIEGLKQVIASYGK